MAKLELPLISRGPMAGSLDMSKIDRMTGSGKQQLIWHPRIPGLALNLSGKGRKSWVIQGKVPVGDGRVKERRLPLLEYGCSAEEVEAKARAWRQAMIEGRNPLEDARREAEAGYASAAPVLDELIRIFLDVRGGKLRPSTVRAYTNTIRLWASDWKERPIDTITPSEVVERYQWIVAEKSASSANTWISGVRSLMNFAVDMEMIERNPCDIMKKQRLYEETPARTNVLSGDGLRTWWMQTEKDIAGGELVWAPLMQFVLLTGVRRSEVGGMRWSEVDFGTAGRGLEGMDGRGNIAGVWEIPAERNKGKRARRIPLTRHGLELLDICRRRTEATNRMAPRQTSNDLVWYTGWDARRPKKRAISAWSWASHYQYEKCGVQASWHDLRRTWSSIAATVIGDAMYKTILGHSTKSDVTLKHYIHFDDEAIRQAMQTVEDRILELAGRPQGVGSLAG